MTTLNAASFEQYKPKIIKVDLPWMNGVAYVREVMADSLRRLYGPMGMTVPQIEDMLAEAICDENGERLFPEGVKPPAMTSRTVQALMAVYKELNTYRVGDDENFPLAT